MNVEQQNAAHSALVLAKVLAKVLVNVQKGLPLDVAYDLVFGTGAYQKLAGDIWEEANK